MATNNIIRRYYYKGPWPLDLKNATDPELTIPNPKFVVAYDIKFDDKVADTNAMDERMRHYGCFPEPLNTQIRSPEPFIGVISPDGNIWKLNVDDLGLLTVIKVS